MFSHRDLPLESETLEYAWLIELTIGDLKGKLTVAQLHPILQVSSPTDDTVLGNDRRIIQW